VICSGRRRCSEGGGGYRIKGLLVKDLMMVIGGKGLGFSFRN